MRPDDEEDNPYERYDIDPLGGPGAITERMRELVEAAPDEQTRKAIRAAWEELTLHPARRLRAALRAHPGSGAGGGPPVAPRASSPRPYLVALEDLAVRPSLLDALDPEDTADPSLLDVSLDRDSELGD